MSASPGSAVHDAFARYGHVAIEGTIGVGKSSLARRLASALDAELLLERPEDNPFLERYYGDPAGYAFQAQLAFLFQRVRQMQGLAQRSMFTPTVVSDYTVAKDALFARLTLSDEEHRLYSQLHGQAVAQLPEPGIVLWLQASTPTLLQRIRGRGLRMEQGISAAYLDRLTEAYTEHFRVYTGAPVVAVDTEAFNPAESDADFDRLVAGIGGAVDRAGAGVRELRVRPADLTG